LDHRGVVLARPLLWALHACFPSILDHLDQRQIRQAAMTDEERPADAAIYGVPTDALDGTGPPSSRSTASSPRSQPPRQWSTSPGCDRPTPRRTIRRSTPNEFEGLVEHERVEAEAAANRFQARTEIEQDKARIDKEHPSSNRSTPPT
jgi:hypothetical protein